MHVSGDDERSRLNGQAGGQTLNVTRSDRGSQVLVSPRWFTQKQKVSACACATDFYQHAPATSVNLVQRRRARLPRGGLILLIGDFNLSFGRRITRREFAMVSARETGVFLFSWYLFLIFKIFFLVHFGRFILVDLMCRFVFFVVIANQLTLNVF